MNRIKILIVIYSIFIIIYSNVRAAYRYTYSHDLKNRGLAFTWTQRPGVSHRCMSLLLIPVTKFVSTSRWDDVIHVFGMFYIPMVPGNDPGIRLVWFCGRFIYCSFFCNYCMLMQADLRLVLNIFFTLLEFRFIRFLWLCPESKYRYETLGWLTDCYAQPEP